MFEIPGAGFAGVLEGNREHRSESGQFAIQLEEAELRSHQHRVASVQKELDTLLQGSGRRCRKPREFIKGCEASIPYSTP